ncbi:MAG: metal-dependent hydrolase [Anaerolineales bacterium]
MTQVGHSLMGLAVGVVCAPRQLSWRSRLGYGVVFAALANLPDLPVPNWGHDRYDISHSVFVNLLLIVVTWITLGWRADLRRSLGGWPVLLGGGLAWLSHLLLDSFYNHGMGVAIFWPFSEASLVLPIPWFSVVPSPPPFTLAHLQEFVAEFVSYSPLVLIALALRRAGLLKRFSTTNSEASFQ